MEKLWSVQECEFELQHKLSDTLGISPIIAGLLVNRGISDSQEADAFLKADLEGLHDPFLMKGMEPAVQRIFQARDLNENVLIFGDYDVDGVTSSTVLNQALTELGINVIHHIPHRMTDGYGLNHDIAIYAKEQGVDLLISIDCGITAVAEIQGLRDAGIDVIVIDHHEPDQGVLPPAVAIVNPKQADCSYPFKELASVGLAFKITQALFKKIPEDILDFAAIGTVADVVPLRGENRILVKHGLPRIARTQNIGLRELIFVSNIKDKPVTPFSIGFVLGPRINASGRMDSALTALNLFLTNDTFQAQRLARVLNKLNLDRQKMQRDVIQEAMAILEETFDEDKDKIIVLSKEGWHKGVLGIVASRIADKYFRPSIVISIEDGVGTASARSVDGFHLHEALSGCAECLENFGGHQGAAGLTIREENVVSFRTMINQRAQTFSAGKPLNPVLAIDAEIPLGAVTMDLIKVLESMEPFGEGNPQPVFCSRDLIVKSNVALMGRDTLKFWVTDGDTTISAVGFSLGGKFASQIRLGGRLDLAYEIIVDDWKKAPIPQLKIKDIQFK